MKIELLENGPILVTKSNNETVALCRCGKSKDAPYCDDSHFTVRRGFPALVIEDSQPIKLPLEVREEEVLLFQTQNGDEFIWMPEEDCCGGSCGCHQGE